MKMLVAVVVPSQSDAGSGPFAARDACQAPAEPKPMSDPNADGLRPNWSAISDPGADGMTDFGRHLSSAVRTARPSR
jgi:hypothetical protein